MNKIKITNWTDFMYILTTLYSIFLICGFFIQFEATVNFFGKDYSTELNLFTWIQTTNPDLEKWKLYLLLICMMGLAILFDNFLIKPLLFKTTKLYKVEKYETLKKYQEIQNEKK